MATDRCVPVPAVVLVLRRRIAVLGVPVQNILLLVTAIAWSAAVAEARSDVTAQFYKVAQARQTLPPIAFLPSPMPESVLKRIKGIEFSELSLPLKHALLWDVGLVASADAGRNAYVQVKVPCGSSMIDIFVARDTVSDPTKGDCGFVVCNAQTLHFTFSNCSLANIEPETKCGILDSDSVTTISPDPIWMEDGDIDSEPFFRVFRKEQVGPVRAPSNRNASSSSSSSLDTSVGSTMTKSTTLFTIVEKRDLNLIDDRVSCPNKASFIVPCRQLSASDVQSAWCDPTPGTFVDLWISQELAQKKSNVEADQDTRAITIFVALFIVAALLCLVLTVCVWRRRGLGKSSHGSGGARSGMGGSLELMDHHHMLMTHHPMLTGESENTVGTAYPNENLSAFTPAELEKVNANFCDRSRDLAEFCDDQELTMKRISYGSLHFSTLIARGANGEVWRGEYANQDVAIKRLLRDKQGEIVYMEVFAREIRLASTLEHPNIVRFIGLSWRSLSELCMVSEFMPSGDLAHYLLSKESRNLSWYNHKITLALDIANALVYLHSLMPVIIHRDLKSLNVLLNENLDAKLSDFGLSRERSFDETMTSGVGTLLWTAPEVLRGDRYTERADIYSFGVVLSELDTCLPPYSLNEEVARAKQKSAQLLPLIRSGQIKPQFRASVPKAIQELALSCLEYVPEKRPNAMQIVYILRSKIMPTLQ